MNRYVFNEKHYGVRLYEILSDLPRCTVNALYTVWEGRGGVGRFSEFLKVQKPNNFVLDLATDVNSQEIKVG